jgi:hypothetical protein
MFTGMFKIRATRFSRGVVRAAATNAWTGYYGIFATPLWARSETGRNGKRAKMNDTIPCPMNRSVRLLPSHIHF